MNRSRPLPLVLAASLLAGCGGAAINSGESGQSVPGVDTENKVIKVGASNAFTGPVSFYQAITQGSNAYLQMINEQGGLDGWTFEYEVLNDDYRPPQHVQNVRRLVEQENVFALVSNQGTPTNTAAAPYLKDKPTPVVSPAEGNPDLSVYDNYFVLMPNYVDLAAVTARYAVEQQGIDNVGILYEDDDLGKPALSGATQALEQLGLEPVASVPFSVDDTNFRPFVSRLQQAGAEAVVIWGSNAHIAASLQAAERLNYDPEWFGPFFLADPATVELAGDLLEGFNVVTWFEPYDSEDPATQEFRSAMEKYEPNTPVGSLAQNGWNGAAFFVEGMRKLIESGDEITQANLIKHLNSFRGETFGNVLAGITYGPDTHRRGYTGVRAVKISQFKDGRFQIVSPALEFPSGLEY